MSRKIDLDKINLTKLQRYNENTLRKCVIIPLLEDLGADNIIDLHGPNEEGVDIYFDTLDIFGHRRRFGIQLKTKDLVCTSRPDKDKNIQTICHQIKSAFSRKIKLPTSEQGKIGVHIDGYYVFTSGKINEIATNYIYQERKAYPYVHIIKGEEILRIIRNRRKQKRLREIDLSEELLSIPLSIGI